jgi:hypothetical protein
MPVSNSASDREREMKMLRERYARQAKNLPPISEKPAAPIEKEEKQIVQPITTKARRNNNTIKAYLFLIENDIRKLFRMKLKAWTPKEKPLDLSWLKKNNGKLF